MKLSYEQLRAGDLVNIRFNDDTLPVLLEERYGEGWVGVDTVWQDDAWVDRNRFASATRETPRFSMSLCEYDGVPVMHLRNDPWSFYFCLWQYDDVFAMVELAPEELAQLQANELDVRDVFEGRRPWKRIGNETVPWPEDEVVDLPEAGVKLHYHEGSATYGSVA